MKKITSILSATVLGFSGGLTFISAFSPWKTKGNQDPTKKYHVLAALAWSEKECRGFYLLLLWFPAPPPSPP